MNKKIMLVGEYVQGAAVYSYERVLKALGYEVLSFDCKKRYFPFLSTWPRLNYIFSCINTVINNYRFRWAVGRNRPEFVFLAKGETISYKSLRFVKRFKIVLINFYPDNPFAVWNGNSNADVLRSLPLYDHFLIWSKMLVPALESAGAQQVHYFPFAYEAAIFPTEIEITQEQKNCFTSDVCFVGTWDPDRERWLTALCERLPEIDIAIWGNDWLEKLALHSPVRKRVRGTALYGTEMIAIFRCAKIVLNFIRRQNMSSHNMRTFEVPASGAFLLTERTYEQAEFLFKENESIACFSSIDELVEKIRFFCSDEDARQKIATKSHEAVAAYQLHTRFEQFFNQLEL
jgi:spore maturation protein CgeB